MNAEIPSYYRYWGKARKIDEQPGDDYHLLPYHCLDVAAVAAYWWDHSISLRKAFINESGLSDKQIRAWVLFFISLHDFGKFDMRFQCKSIATWLELNPDDQSKSLPSIAICKEFDHGKAGLFWFSNDNQPDPVGDMGSLTVLLSIYRNHPYQSWFPWFEAVTGHHGYVIAETQVSDHSMPYEFRSLSERDKTARKEWIMAMERMFLLPEKLSICDQPPVVSPLLAGFCSVADWLGSWLSEDTFRYLAKGEQTDNGLQEYFQRKYKEDASIVIARSGLLGKPNRYLGVQALLDEGHFPRQLQILVDHLPKKPGITLIEAPTGSGKTETALAYAWNLLEEGVADSIVFALPTQATANAMLKRLNKLAKVLFDNPNLILAHGNALFNNDFRAIKQHGRSAQGREEAWAQCCEWLSQSRKRVFLGQIGVCTIDQVLVSVLPVKHRFVRGFGVGRSVLIVDEVHAYDTYMYGLLEEVLKNQHRAGRSAILLSATLPEYQKEALLNTYGKGDGLALPEHYPLVAWRNDNESHCFDLTINPEHLPPPFQLYLEPLHIPDALPDTELYERLVRAAHTGAQVCLICNLVDVAQTVYQALKNTSGIEVMLFHARFTLLDRRAKEDNALACFDKEGDRSIGRILIATQVVEQSLDLDFDWLITQHCPVDLLFQRLGRLHRHEREGRPVEFSVPHATVLLPEGDGYGIHGLIYSNTPVMWRTQQKIESLCDTPLRFPDVYRQWIKSVYLPDLDGQEPDWVSKGFYVFQDEELKKRSKAGQMLRWASDTALNDEDSNIRAVTRDGEMSLPVVPYVDTAVGRQLLNGIILESLPEFEQQEALALNRVNVPHHWEKLFLQKTDDDGVLWLPGLAMEDGYFFKGKDNIMFSYTRERGMEKSQ